MRVDLSKLAANSDVIASRYRAINPRAFRQIFKREMWQFARSDWVTPARFARNSARIPTTPTVWGGTFSSTPAEQPLDYASGTSAKRNDSERRTGGARYSTGRDQFNPISRCDRKGRLRRLDEDAQAQSIEEQKWKKTLVLRRVVRGRKRER